MTPDPIFHAPLGAEMLLLNLLSMCLPVIAIVGYSWWFGGKKNIFRVLKQRTVICLLSVFIAYSAFLSVGNYLTAPITYRLTSNAIEIQSRAQIVAIPLKSLARASIDDRSHWERWNYNPWRLFVTGGLGGVHYLGTSHVVRWGGPFGIAGTADIEDMYLTNFEHVVVLDRSDGERDVVISPDHPQQFINIVMKRLTVPQIPNAGSP